jgi:pimeloyl-ACP methyl ester carboxylesterase
VNTRPDTLNKGSHVPVDFPSTFSEKDAVTVQRQHWSTTPRLSRSIETSKGRLEYCVVGDGYPILYFHGTGAGNDCAVVMENSLLEDGFRLIVPNRPGYYGTPLSCGRTSNDCADLAVELLDDLSIDVAAVIGTSGGGPPAIRFAARYPSRTAALVLQCAQCHHWDSSRWMPPRLRWAYRVFRHQRFFKPFLRVGFRREMSTIRREPQSIIRQMSGERYPEIENDDAAVTLAPLLVESELRCAAQPRGIENDWAMFFSEPWLIPGEIRCPTLILQDQADPLVPFAHAEWARQSIPGAQLVDLHAGGHLIWVGHDAERMRNIRADFIRQHLVRLARN